ncbi:NADH-quinone oxidoreductase subunit H [Myxococcota bacterium]|nr:NADH-quinone oxidoreductase subunit H [Myxococcota bacterium]
MSVAEKLMWVSLTLMGGISYGLLTNGVVRKIMARIQGRYGPPVYQPFIDLGKTLFLRTGIRHGPMFVLGPVFRATGGVGLLLLMPVVIGDPRLENYQFMGDILLAMYFMFFGSLGMALGGSDSGHPHSAIGPSRGLAQMTAYELPFVLGIIAIVAQSGSFSMEAIIDAQQGGFTQWFIFQNPLASAAAFLALLGMNLYPPFNLVGAPQEIPVGPATEYHATYMSLLASGRAAFAIGKLIFFMNIFLGGAHSLLEMFIKTFIIYMWSIAVGAVFPRFRTEQAIRFFLGWPTAFGVGGVLMVIFWG